MTAETVLIRLPKNRLSSIIAILQGLADTFPEAEEIQSSIEIVSTEQVTAPGDQGAAVG